LKIYAINALEIETFDFFYEIVSPFEILKECHAALVNKTQKITTKK